MAPAPGGTDDLAADMERLMQELFGQLFQGLAPNGEFGPWSRPGGNERGAGGMNVNQLSTTMRLVQVPT